MNIKVLAFFASCASMAPILFSVPAIAAEKIALTASQRQQIQSAIRSRLKDPESARFGSMSAVVDGSKKVHVCGYVNSKNSFGGYVGDELFYGVFNGSRFDMEMKAQAGNDLTSRIVVRTCSEHGIGG